MVFVALLGLRSRVSRAAFLDSAGSGCCSFRIRIFPWLRRACWNQRAGCLESTVRVLAPLVLLFAVLVYTLTVTANWKMALVDAAYSVLPALLVASSAGKAPGTWEDYAAAILIWLPVEFRWMYRRYSRTQRELVAFADDFVGA